jgi:hypothetical protein
VRLTYPLVILPADDCEKLLALVTQLEADVARNPDVFGTTNVPDRMHAIGALMNRLKRTASSLVIPVEVGIGIGTD